MIQATNNMKTSAVALAFFLGSAAWNAGELELELSPAAADSPRADAGRSSDLQAPAPEPAALMA